METILLSVHVLLGVAVIGLVLIQQGKGADAGASFGGGASQTVFGSAGSGSFLVKLTAGLSALFFITSLTLAVIAIIMGIQCVGAFWGLEHCNNMTL